KIPINTKTCGERKKLPQSTQRFFTKQDVYKHKFHKAMSTQSFVKFVFVNTLYNKKLCELCGKNHPV
ncbi:MAG: hypothetical protein WAM46_19660, partial [Flavobacterium sp.]